MPSQKNCVGLATKNEPDLQHRTERCYDGKLLPCVLLPIPGFFSLNLLSWLWQRSPLMVAVWNAQNAAHASDPTEYVRPLASF